MPQRQDHCKTLRRQYDSGASGDNFMSAEEKAYREAMKTVAQKEAKDWTLDEQKAAATDIAKNGTSSVAYAKAKAAMDAGTTWSVKLTNGKALEYRIVGINHDDLADGSGKAGITFETTNTALGFKAINVAQTNIGRWEKSELRTRLNAGDLWSLLPSELQSKVKSVKKMNDNKGGGKADTPSSTTDKIFLLSVTEVYGDMQSDGTQYEFYKSKGVTTSNHSRASSSESHWTRSVHPDYSSTFRYVSSNGRDNCNDSSIAYCVFPAFCF